MGKQLVVLLAVCGGAFADADAQIGLHGAGALGYAGGAVGVAAAPAVVAQRVATAPHCQTTYDTITSQQCTTVSEPVCHTRTITQTETRTEQACTSRPVEECHAVPRPVTEEVCTPAEEPECHNVVDVIQEQHCEQVAEQQCTQVEQCHQEQQCHDEITTIVDTTTIEDCQDITEQVCTQASVSVAHSSNVVGHNSGVAGFAVAPAAAAAVGVAGVAGVAGGVEAVGYAGAGLINHHLGKREAEADADVFYGTGYAAGATPLVGGHTSAPNCHAETRRVCNPRTVETPRQISNPVCVSVPREVPRTVCG